MVRDFHEDYSLCGSGEQEDVRPMASRCLCAEEPVAKHEDARPVASEQLQSWLDGKSAMGKFRRLCVTDPGASRRPFMTDSARWPVIDEGLMCVLRSLRTCCGPSSGVQFPLRACLCHLDPR